MIAKLTGIVDSHGEDWVIIDVGGVGYLAFCSGRTLSHLRVGEAARLYIETHVREDHIHLYGFIDIVERDWFRLLTVVQGVGAKVALAILTVHVPETLMTAIAAGDRAVLTQAAGVGPKLAGRILSELKDKVGAIVLAPAMAGRDANGGDGGGGGGIGAAVSEAISALVNLGYSPSDAMTAVSHGAGKLGSDAEVEALIRAGLAELGPRDQRVAENPA